ncbi:MAG: two-component system response regulator [Gammaproteobacteria bacterium]|nr:two-component system response regulator [Gammaproteobacteria bacterium]
MNNGAIRKHKILAVDDEPANLMLLREVLQNDYHIIFAKNGQDALKRMVQKPDLVLLDIMMPEMDGFEVCTRLKSQPLTKNIPVIFLTAKITVQDEIKGLELGAVDYITKPLSPPVLRMRIKTQLALYDQNQALEEKVNIRTKELQDTRLQVIQRLGRAAEFKDNETGLHIIRMSNYSQILALAIGLSKEEGELILNAAPMHDVGKIGIPDNILLKPGKLTASEWEIMQQHPQMGADIIRLDDSELLSAAKTIALSHHEKWNGCGYPAGLKGEQIHLYARIVAVADVFDALTSERPYKKAWAVEETLNLLQSESGKHFEPKLISSFLKMMPEILQIKAKYEEKNGPID